MTVQETQSTDTLKQRQREMLLKTALSYGAGVWLLLQAGRDGEDVADCAYDAWAASQAAEADEPWARWEALHEARYGRLVTAPDIRLVVNNTRR